ncbi:ATP-binding protein [Hyperthermus butylicus]|uniref:Conserved crenarchaeal protein n=1 Tax=Hyperthermus butylicus (strain DSM 5456 / JCM 9403 / PLM1-5) TaxID=415426 RepID=A2BN00_HYPBU|nr:ATP-binding protein [Hyperthermus butylicus]ABM81361.1 conserved crenarchaeal protein [Hyperthermus butylicus DSM 5456]
MTLLVGFVLSGSTSDEAKIQLTEAGEERLREGQLVIIESNRGSELLLARIERIVPVNEFFVEGDPWSEARRRGLLPPLAEEVARRYTLAEAAILGKAGRRGLEEPDRPPKPGDRVRMLGSGELEKLLGVERDAPGVVWYGELLGYEGLGLPLDIENITMHVGVFGETGSGKSYGVGYMLELLSRIPLGDGRYGALPAVVVDANGDYLDYHEAFASGHRLGEYHAVYRLVFPRSPARFEPYTRTVTIDLDVFTARELAEFIVTYKSGGVDVNELQVAALERVLRELGEEYQSYTEIFTRRVSELYELLSELSTGRGAPIHPQTARAVRSAVDKFVGDIVEGYGVISRKPSIDKGFIDELTAQPSLAIIDFSAEGAPGIPLPVRQLVVAYLARLLYKVFTEYKVRGEERYLALVIEEAQNYAPNPRTYPVAWSLARDYLALIATQGRKFGLCLVLVSQRPAFVDPVVLSMVNTWIIYRLAVEDIPYVSKLSGGLPRSLERRLTRLPRGIAVVTGQMNMLGFPALVRTGRRRVSHAMGRTRLVESLRRVYGVGEGAGGKG